MSNCLFCKIADKELDSDIVYEDEHVLAFNDISPKAPVHVLIIPKGEYVSSSDFSAKASAEGGYATDVASGAYFAGAGFIYNFACERRSYQFDYDLPGRINLNHTDRLYSVDEGTHFCLVVELNC